VSDPRDQASGRGPISDDELNRITVGERKAHNAPITLADYNPAWPKLFAHEADRVLAALGPGALLLEHVGSTSVPGLAAKPIIDMLLVVPNSADEPSYVPGLDAAGYRLWIREPAWFEHRLFNGSDTRINLHVFSAGCPEIERLLRFRDRLRSCQADREHYERTKRRLAQQVWQHVQHYADAKTTIIKEILSHTTTTESR
jgi:GrpB-like predicted nucleotidyltransferase (UPF0157 family)